MHLAVFYRLRKAVAFVSKCDKNVKTWMDVTGLSYTVVKNIIIYSCNFFFFLINMLAQAPSIRLPEGESESLVKDCPQHKSRVAPEAAGVLGHCPGAGLDLLLLRRLARSERVTNKDALC